MQSETADERVDAYLAACVRAALANKPCPTFPFETSHHEIAKLVMERARFHGICALLAQAPDALTGWPERPAAAVREEMRLAALWEELHRARIVEVIEQLADAGVETMVMKGTALAYLHYPDPSVRRRGDTDLLIQAKDLAMARKVLIETGCFAREDPLGLYFQETWLFDSGAGMQHAIDLHWEPVDHTVLQRVLGSDLYWKHRIPVPRLSTHASAPDSLVMLVHGALNQAWHAHRGLFVEDERVFGARRLLWSVDYLRITQKFGPDDWTRLADYCAENDAAAVVHAALEGAHRDLELDVPRDVLSRLALDAKGSPSLRHIRNRSAIVDFIRNLRASRQPLVQWKMLTSMAFPSRIHLDQKYPQLAHWPSALLHLRRYFEVIIRIAGGEAKR